MTTIDQTYWGFREAPFPGTLDARTFYASPTHEEALARLHFLVAGRRRLGLLLGGSGSGKSLLLQVLASDLSRQGRQVARLSVLGLAAEEFLAGLARRWQLNSPPTASLRELWGGLDDRLTEFRCLNVAPVVLCDDADLATPELVTQLARLVTTPASAQGRMTIVLAAGREGLERLGCRLLELIDLRIDVHPWDLEGTRDFVQRSLARAGRTAAAFEPSALERLHELCQGNPRRVQQLADLALLAAAARRLPQVDAFTIENVFDELSIRVAC